jgi:hypothetical protein
MLFIVHSQQFGNPRPFLFISTKNRLQDSKRHEEMIISFLYVWLFWHLQVKNFIFWDITPCIPLKVNQPFGGTCRFHLQDRKISQARNQHDAGSKHGFISQKTEYFITIAVITANSASLEVFPKFKGYQKFYNSHLKYTKILHETWMHKADTDIQVILCCPTFWLLRNQSMPKVLILLDITLSSPTAALFHGSISCYIKSRLSKESVQIRGFLNIFVTS